MKINGQKTAFILFLGDIFFLVAALWLTLLFRYAAWPEWRLFYQHLSAFAFIFAAWVGVFFIFDLYRKPTVLFRRQLPSLLLRAQVVNTVVAIVFFYYVPIFGITPRTNLFIYLIISFGLIMAWRAAARYWGVSGRRLNMVFVCTGAEVEELKAEIRSNPRYNLTTHELSALKAVPHDSSLVVVFNPYDESGRGDHANLYRLIFAGVTFLNVHELYEEVFDRIPLSIIGEQWFLENISSRSTMLYDLFKRFFDIVVASILGVGSLILYPFIIAAIKLEDGQSVFISQERVGQNGRLIKIWKFRSMTGNDAGAYEGPAGTVLRVTRVGRFLRMTRLDELPQLWSVIKGDLSLIGPRPELPALASQYEREISYYSIRHLITPGLSGWAQMYHDNHPHHAAHIGATKEKLSYDLFYLKNRGIILDLVIGLKTLRILFGSKGI